MKRSKVSLAMVLFVIITSAVGMSKELYATDANKGAATDIKKNFISEDPDKAIVIANKAKIDQEREAILADGRKLQEVKKSGDKVLIEQVSNEIAQDIKKRKTTIRSLKDEIQAREGGPSAPSGRRRVK